MGHEHNELNKTDSVRWPVYVAWGLVGAFAVTTALWEPFDGITQLVCRSDAAPAKTVIDTSKANTINDTLKNYHQKESYQK
jgi:hypothetical protein